jgi:hypothetical protein
VIVETGQQIVDEGKSFWEDPFGYVIAPFVAIDDAIDEIIHPEKDRFDQLTEGVMQGDLFYEPKRLHPPKQDNPPTVPSSNPPPTATTDPVKAKEGGNTDYGADP